MAFKHPDPRKDVVDARAYAPDNPAPETFYGLPRTVAFCRKCVISNQRPNSAVEYRR